jgi:hypothetical protein
MRTIEVETVYIRKGVLLLNDDDADSNTDFAFVMKDGTLIDEFDGCDWKENPAKNLIKLTRKLKKGDELVEMADGSDMLWYGILRKKPKKIDLTARNAAIKAEEQRIKRVRKQALAKLTAEEKEVLGLR